MSLMSLWKGRGANGFGYTSTAEQVTAGVDLNGQTILLTGCNSGIGKETLRVLTRRGAHVIATARTVEKAQAACNEVGGATTPVACELSEPASVKACAEEVMALGRHLDAIICNAGVMALRELGQTHGYEAQFFTNHIGHFTLVTSLLDQLADDGRVVMVASEAHKGAPPEGIQFDNLSGERKYGTWQAYGLKTGFVDVPQRESRSHAGEPLGEQLSEATRGAGYQDDLVFEFAHVRPPRITLGLVIAVTNDLAAVSRVPRSD